MNGLTIPIISAIVSLIILSGCSPWASLPSASSFSQTATTTTDMCEISVHFTDVGHGDSMLVSSGETGIAITYIFYKGLVPDVESDENVEIRNCKKY